MTTSSTSPRDADRHFRIQGMDCADEVAVLQRALRPLVGDDGRLSFDLLQSKLIVGSGAEAPTDAILTAMAETGMQAEIWRDRPIEGGRPSVWARHGHPPDARGALRRRPNGRGDWQRRSRVRVHCAR